MRLVLSYYLVFYQFVLKALVSVLRLFLFLFLLIFLSKVIVYLNICISLQSNKNKMTQKKQIKFALILSAYFPLRVLAQLIFNV